MRTIAEELRAEGKAEGKAEGRAEGRAEGNAKTLGFLLEGRFGPLSRNDRDRIDGADPAEVEAWLEAVLDAPSLSAVFARRPKRAH